MPKIKNIEFVNHPIFRTTKFDFCCEDGTPANTVTLAGENGSGKTRLLEELYHGTKCTYRIEAPIRQQRQTIINIDLTDSQYYDYINPSAQIDSAKLITSSDTDSEEQYHKVEFYRKDSLVLHVGARQVINRVTDFSLNSAYSGTDINYIPRHPVEGVTSLDLDSGELYESEDVAHDVTQLLIDIASQDNDEIALRVSQHPHLPVPKSLREDLRMKRFSRAFTYMFGDSLKYKTIRDNIHPIFEKHGIEIPIDTLSSGEKQIVFRGVYLLRNINNLSGCPIFIDEPELSMHPKWAKQIYGYYKSLFLDANHHQTSQIFIATHNEYVVKSAIEDDHSIILGICIDCQTSRKLSKNTAGEILPKITLSEIKYLVFGIYSADFHVHLYAYIQNNLVGSAAVRGMDDYLLHYKAPKKKSSFMSGSRMVTYHSLPTYIRNAIDHPDDTLVYTEAELKQSTDWMLDHIKKVQSGKIAKQWPLDSPRSSN